MTFVRFVERSDYDSNEIGKDAYHGPGNKNEHQHSSDALFKVCVFAKKVARIEKEADQKDDSQKQGENGSDGIRDVVDRILDTSNLCKSGDARKEHGPNDYNCFFHDFRFMAD